MLNRYLSNEKLVLYLSTIIFIIISLGALWNSKSLTGEVFFAHSHIVYKEYLLSVAIIFFLILYLLKNGIYKKPTLFSFSQLEASFLIFFLFASISIFWADDISSFTHKWFLYAMGVTTYFIFKKLKLSKINFDVISILASFAILTISLIGLSQRLFDIPDVAILSRVNDTGSTFGNKNMAGHIIVLLFPLLIYRLSISKRFMDSILSDLVFILCIFYVYLAASKAVWIALTIELITILFYYILTKKRLFIFSIKRALVFLLFLFIPFKAIDLSPSLKIDPTFTSSPISKFIPSAQKELSSLGARLSIWRSSLRYINDSPVLGHGLGNFTDELSTEGNFHLLKRAHNDILELIVDIGFIGLILFLVFVFFVIKNQINIIKNEKHEPFFNLLFIGLIGTSTNLMVSWPFQLLPPILIVAIYIAILNKKGSSLSTSNNFFELKLNPAFLNILLIVPIIFSYYSVKNFNNELVAPNIGIVNSGTRYHKYNFAGLLEAPRHFGQDSELYNFYMDFLNAGYAPRATEIMEIAVLKNPRNMYALRKLFEIYLKKREFDKAKEYIDRMKLVKDYHSFILLSDLEYFQYTNQKNKAIDIYEKYKNEFISGRDSYPAILKNLVMWSIKLGKYEDTEKLYELSQTYTELFEDINLNTSMAKFYAYTGNKQMGLKYFKIYSENHELISHTGFLEDLPEAVINFYKDI